MVGRLTAIFCTDAVADCNERSIMIFLPEKIMSQKQLADVIIPSDTENKIGSVIERKTGSLIERKTGPVTEREMEMGLHLKFSKFSGPHPNMDQIFPKYNGVGGRHHMGFLIPPRREF